MSAVTVLHDHDSPSTTNTHPATNAHVLSAVAVDVCKLAPKSDAIVPSPTFVGELRATLTNPLFLLISFGFAGWVAVVAGFSVFMPTLVEVCRVCEL
jgi:hypothetical protein